jgi:cytochrome P450
MAWRDRVRGLLARGIGRGLIGWEKLRSGAAYDPFDRRLRTDPHPLLRQLRERDPAHRSRLFGGFVFTRYDDVYSILTDRRFSADESNNPGFEKMLERSRRLGILDPNEEIPPSMLRSDPPVHTRLRKLVSKAFTPRSIRKLQPRIESIVHEHLDAVEVRGELELIRDLAYPLPVIVIAEMLGVPAEDREQFKHWSDEVVLALGFVENVEDARRSRRAGRALNAYLEDIANQRRRDPADDLISGLLLAEEQGDTLSMPEILSICQLILIAGHETTTKLIGNGMLALLENRDQFELLKSDLGLVESAVEEILRFGGPVQMTSRIATQDIELGGVTVRKGQNALAVVVAANRDPARFPDPDRFWIERPTDPPHIAFGQGVHFCLGANLARMETQAALRALVTRFPDMRLTDQPLEWGDNLILRGLKKLPISLT